MDILYKKEKTLFTIMAIISLLFWIGVVVGTAGVALVILAVMYILYLFAHSAFISYVKGTGVRIGKNQFPELHKQATECASKLGMKSVPEIYILNANGFINALATKFLKQHYVVLYSELVDAFESKPQALNFYIGHEFGHIQRGHLKWGPFLWPASLFPLLGAAYSRAREYTCDLHGIKCSEDIKDAAFAMGMLAAGPGQWPKLNLAEYGKQSKETGGFWMSLHELTGTYPWLCKRMQCVLAVHQNTSPKFPSRHLGAWILACFVPNSGLGGLGSIIGVAYIGILAAIAIPAYQDYTIRAVTTPAFQSGEQVESSINQYIEQHNELPADLNDTNFSSTNLPPVIKSINLIESGFAITLTGKPQIDDQTIEYEVRELNGELTWYCTGGTLPPKYRPEKCK